MGCKGCLFIFFLPIGSLLAATWVGVNGGMNANQWNVDANWSNPAVTPNATDAIAAIADTAYTTPTLSGSITLGTITFTATSTYTIQPTVAETITFGATSPNAALSLSGSGTLNITTQTILSSPLTVSQNSTGNLTFTNRMSGSGLLTISGSGTTVLQSTSNSYSGGTTISSGTLVAQGNTLGTGAVTIGAATLKFQTGGAFSSSLPYILSGSAMIDVTTGTQVTITGGISGTGSLQKTDSGTLILSPGNSYSGGTTISAGEVDVSNDSCLGNTAGSLNLAGGVLKTVSSNFSSARSGNISGSSTFNTNLLSDTLSGNFSGSGSLTVIGGGTLTLSGTNSYSGGTTVGDGAVATSLVGTTNSLSGPISVLSLSSVTFAQNFDGTYGDVLQGAGALKVNGAAVVTLSGISTLTGNTSVQAGTLLVTGSLANSAITVSSGATLSGTGTVGATTINNGGTLSPGISSTPGTLSINGNLTLNNSSAFPIHLTPTSTDLVAVTGTANLAGGHVTVNPAPGFYAPTSSYTVLTATNPLATQFASVSSSSSNFVILSTSYANSQVVLLIQALNPFFLFPFSNRNTAAVGNNIDALSLAGELSPTLVQILDSFVGHSNDQINAALDQMHPAPYSALTEWQEEMGAKVVSLFHRKPALCRECHGRNRWWIRPFGNSLTEKNHGMQFGFTANTGGVAAGYDGEILEDWMLGMGAAWDYTHFDWHSHHGQGDINGIYGAVYSDYQVWNFYFGGAFLAGVDLYDTSRHIHFFTTHEQAKADFHGFDMVAQLNGAYYFGSPTILLYPYANFDFLYSHLPSFQEQGASGLNLKVNSHTASTFRTEMGLAFQVQDTNENETVCISPLFSIGWVNMCPLQRPPFHSRFVGTTIPFTTFGWDETWNLLSLEFDLGITYRCFSFTMEYNVEMSADKETLLFNQNGDVRLSWKY